MSRLRTAGTCASCSAFSEPEGLPRDVAQDTTAQDARAATVP
jgi:hypothetical protein